MNPYQRKIFGIVPVWAAAVVLGCVILLATAVGSFLYQNELRERVKTANAPTPTPYLLTETVQIENRINFLDDQIKSEQTLAQMNRELPFSAEETKSRTAQSAEKIKKWENEIAALKAKKEELSQKPPEPKQVSWFEKYNIEGLFAIALTGTFAVGAALTALLSRTKISPGDLLTDLDQRALFFLGAAVLGSLSGFLLFLWYLSVLT